MTQTYEMIGDSLFVDKLIYGYPLGIVYDFHTSSQQQFKRLEVSIR